MEQNKSADFLRNRIIQLREKNGKSQSDMATLLNTNKSTLSRVESGNTSYKNIKYYAEEYCRVLGMTEEQITLFMGGLQAVIPDTSALMKNPQLIYQLVNEYNWVIIPRIVIDELDNLKDHDPRTEVKSRAWSILKAIGSEENKILIKEYEGTENDINNDSKIIEIAKQSSDELNSEVTIITYDAGFAARLNKNPSVHSLFLENYLANKLELVNIEALKKIDEYYADSYEDIGKILNIAMPSPNDINAYLANGFTLLISVVRNRKQDLEQRKKKIKWLIENGADVNKRDCGKYNFPALSHAVQNNDFEIFKYLLHECNANPNIGSRNPLDVGKIRQKNDGNMPLMIAAWDNKVNFVKELCADPRTSLNQQDGNGFTALIKACYWGWDESRDVLLAAGADTKIVDRDGFTAEGRYNEFLETGRRKKDKFVKYNKKGHPRYDR